MNKKILKKVIVHIVILIGLFLLFVQFREHGILYLLEAYLILKTLSLLLGLYYCRKIKHKPVTVTFVALVLAIGGFNMAWMFSLAIVYNKYHKELKFAKNLARFDDNLEQMLV